MICGLVAVTEDAFALVSFGQKSHAFTSFLSGARKRRESVLIRWVRKYHLAERRRSKTEREGSRYFFPPAGTRPRGHHAGTATARDLGLLALLVCTAQSALRSEHATPLLFFRSAYSLNRYKNRP